MKKPIFFITALFIIFLLPGFLHGAISALERAALIALYNSTNGGSWTDNTGWKDGTLEADGFGPVGSEDSWFGIDVNHILYPEESYHVAIIALRDNQLTGSIPSELGNLLKLQQLDLSQNQLTGSIPSSLGNLINLAYFNLATNQLTGSIPSSLGNLTGLTQTFALSYNQLTGSIPSSLGNLIYLVDFDLIANQLTGSIPSELGNLINLQTLSLDHNQLTGTIPSSFGNLTNLIGLGITFNQLTGSIPPQLGNLANLQYLGLDYNQLTGCIPPELGNLVTLNHLFLDNNHLSGSIPSELGKLTNLSYLWLNNNHLSGNIPSELGNLVELSDLRLQINQLVGSIPTSLINLVNLISGYTYIDHNALYTSNSALLSFLDIISPDWKATQTIAPTDMTAVATSSHSINVTWTPIIFTNWPGGYKVYYSTTSGGPWIYSGITADKSTASYTVSGLSPNTTYYFVIKTKTNSNIINSNTVESDYSLEASATTSSAVPPEISLNRSTINFCNIIGSTNPTTQSILVSNSGESTLNWTASTVSSWIVMSPTSGSGSGVILVSFDPAGLPAGTYTDSILVSDSNAINSPRTVTVNLTVKSASQDQPPFGDFATPINGSTVSSSVPVTGWVVDDVGVDSLKIYMGNTGALVYIGDAIFVEGARPDIEAAYPDYPMNYQAGWGYMMLTNFLPGGGNGTFTIHAIATDTEGNQSSLGFKTIIVDNANAVKPFGAIDTPIQGGSASGSSFRIHGWVLTPMPNAVPTNGSTIDVYVDGVTLGNPTYNVYRPDIAESFPGYANSDGAHAYLDFDTTAYDNGVHSIFWIATDNAGNSDGIGSRFFSIQNTGSSGTRGAKNQTGNYNYQKIDELPENYDGFEVKNEYGKDIKSRFILPDEKGISKISIKELDILEIKLSNPKVGFMVAGNKLYPLPVGATLDTVNSIFSWTPGPGFLGDYRLVFIEDNLNGEISKRVVIVRITPKY